MRETLLQIIHYRDTFVGFYLRETINFIPLEKVIPGIQSFRNKSSFLGFSPRETILGSFQRQSLELSEFSLGETFLCNFTGRDNSWKFPRERDRQCKKLSLRMTILGISPERKSIKVSLTDANL